MNTDFKIPSQTVFLETYGCQMNKYDSEMIYGILHEKGYQIAQSIEGADIVLINTCSIREHAEKRTIGRISTLNNWKNKNLQRKLGVIGCMAQRLGNQLLNNNPHIDFIIGPDEYRMLPEILQNGHQKPTICTTQHEDESYSEIIPYHSGKTSGFVAIMRGCNNFCSYCIVPYTRGPERSRPVKHILTEIEKMSNKGYKEVILLGQNVNSYHDQSNDFSDLLEQICMISGILRIRFMTSHPKDLSDKLLDVINKNPKICSHIHLPVQSGANRILQSMNRGYTLEDYMILIEKARNRIPGVAITTDVMVGFPGETESDFEDTVDLIKTIRFNEAFTYYFSVRIGTKAANYKNQIPLLVKKKRLEKIIQIQRTISLEKKQELIGHKYQVLPECPSKRSKNEWMGRTDQGEIVIFPLGKKQVRNNLLQIQIETLRGSTLRGKILKEFL